MRSYFCAIPEMCNIKKYVLKDYIILYYSTCKKEFWVTPKFYKDTKAQGKLCIIGPFKQRSNGKIMHKDKYMISLTERTCSVS